MKVWSHHGLFANLKKLHAPFDPFGHENNDHQNQRRTLFSPAKLVLLAPHATSTQAQGVSAYLLRPLSHVIRAGTLQAKGHDLASPKSEDDGSKHARKPTVSTRHPERAFRENPSEIFRVKARCSRFLDSVDR